jgi:hypothetical protein
MVYAMTTWKRILILTACVLALAFPLFAYAENNLGSTGDPSEAEQTTTTRSAIGDAVEAESVNGTEEPVDPNAETITEKDTPLSKLPFEPGWALVNLLASLVSIIIGVTLVTYAMLRRPHGDQPDLSDSQLPQNFGLAVFGMLAAVISTILFTSTEDLSMRMILVDSFTVAHIAVLAISILCAALTLKRDLGDPINQDK